MKYTIDNTYFSNIDTEEKAYILGLLYADGNVSSSNNSINIVFQTKDNALLNDIKTQLASTHPIKHKATFSSFTFSNKQIKSDLISHGCVPAKSKILTFPTHIQKDLMPHFLRGYFDGDGSISSYNTKTKHKHREKQSDITVYNCDITSSTIFITALLQYIKTTLSINGLIKIPHKERNDGTISTLSINGNRQIKTFLDHIYNNSNIKMSRKYSKYLELLEAIKNKYSACCVLCNKKIYADMLCQRHYKLTKANKQEKPCSICGAVQSGHSDFCKRHYDIFSYYKKQNREDEFYAKYNIE